MAWDHLSVTKAHLVYILLGGFTTLFMLCSSIIKERLYIGEATVATVAGLIFGPYVTDLIDPSKWGNTDAITLEFSRIVLVVQCFAVGVELPRNYMEKHWRSVVFLLVPVMTFGWLATSLFIWSVFHASANWLDCLCIAACVTATDPVLASSVVGKGKFAKRVPKHLRDVLSAESGCNDGMAFPFIYLSLYIIRYRHHPDEVSMEWFCITILYECIFGAIYGFCIGYAARRLIRYSHEKDWIDRESFLVFYFVLSLFCAGSGSILGMDDLLIGFSCGVGFSNDGWFTEKTEESHVSNVIDLLLNLAFFVYFGTIIPWDQYNSGILNLDAWRLVVIAILVLLFRRIPIMLALKPVIPDIKTWREALFAGHFGPIGVGAIYAALLSRAELESGQAEPERHLPDPNFPHYNIIKLIWPITTFLIITSILVHGSSIAVFTLGKHINTLTLTLSYTQANEDGTSWMDRLPRIQSRSKSTMSWGKYDSELDEKAPPPGMLPSVARPGTFLRRQRESDKSDRPLRARSYSPSRFRRPAVQSWDSGRGYGGPISQSAIAPMPRPSAEPQDRSASRSDSETRRPSSSADDRQQEHVISPGEIYEEGDQTVYEDHEGNVLAVEKEKCEGAEREAEERVEGRRLMHEEQEQDKAEPDRAAYDNDEGDGDGDGNEILEKIKSAEDGERKKLERLTTPEGPSKEGWRDKLVRIRSSTNVPRQEGVSKPSEHNRPEKKSGPARAYQYGNTIVIEDEDGEVIKKYDIPAPEKKTDSSGEQSIARHRIGQMGKYFGLGGRYGNDDSNQKTSSSAPGPSSGQAGASAKAKPHTVGDDDDDQVRFTLGGGGRRMSKADFIETIQQMDPKRRAQIVENSNAPEQVKLEARKEVREQAALHRRPTMTNRDNKSRVPVVQEHPSEHNKHPEIRRTNSNDSNDLKLVDSTIEVPMHNVSADLRRYQLQSSEGDTAAERRRRQIAARKHDDGFEDDSNQLNARGTRTPVTSRGNSNDLTQETAAERRRRLGALGLQKNIDNSDSEDEDEDDRLQRTEQRQNIRFADNLSSSASASAPRQRQRTLRWGADPRH